MEKRTAKQPNHRYILQKAQVNNIHMSLSHHLMNLHQKSKEMTSCTMHIAQESCIPEVPQQKSNMRTACPIQYPCRNDREWL